MQSFRSHQLQKIGKELHPLATTRELSELEAQELLFEISKIDDPADQHDHFIKEMIKNSPYRKTYEKIALSLPKQHKRESGVNLAGGRVTRNSEHNSSGQSVGISRYFVTQPATWWSELDPTAGGTRRYPESQLKEAMCSPFSSRATAKLSISSDSATETNCPFKRITDLKRSTPPSTAPK